MTTKHTPTTPGPWKVRRVNSREDMGWAEFDISTLNPVDGCFGNYRDYHNDDQGDANAALIARAPELEAENQRLRHALAGLLAAIEADCERAPDMTVQQAYETNGRTISEAIQALKVPK